MGELADKHQLGDIWSRSRRTREGICSAEKWGQSHAKFSFMRVYFSGIVSLCGWHRENVIE